MPTTTCPLRMSRPFRGGASTPFAISSHMFKARPLVGRGEMQDKQHMSSPSGTEHGTSHPQDHAGVQVIERTCNRAAVRANPRGVLCPRMLGVPTRKNRKNAQAAAERAERTKEYDGMADANVRRPVPVFAKPGNASSPRRSLGRYAANAGTITPYSTTTRSPLSVHVRVDLTWTACRCYRRNQRSSSPL